MYIVKGVIMPRGCVIIDIFECRFKSMSELIAYTQELNVKVNFVDSTIQDGDETIGAFRLEKNNTVLLNINEDYVKKSDIMFRIMSWI